VSEMVLNTSAEAASWRTGLEGWVSRRGHYFGVGSAAERVARYDGCTHVACADCGTATTKGYTHCGGCRAKRVVERHAAMPREAWDGERPINIYGTDSYFFSEDDLRDYCEEEGCGPESLRLVFCIPNPARELSLDHWCDDYPDDQEPPTWLSDAVEELNRVIRAHHADPLSWSPGHIAVVISAAALGLETGPKGGEE